MIFFHVDRALAAYLHGELAPAERQRIERHLARCSRCREAAERLRAVHAALPRLPVCAAPDALWQRIEQGLNGTRAHSGARASAHMLGIERDAAQGAASDGAHGQTPEQAGEQADIRDLRRILLRPAPVQGRLILALGSLAMVLVGGIVAKTLYRPPGAGWEVRTLQGRPVIGWFPFGARGKLRVDECLTTDRGSSAEIAVADIGTVKVAPGSRVRLAETGRNQHRLSLEKGALEAKVTAQPRLFVVDTPIGKAVDLGCAYRLETDGRQSTFVKVTLGKVSLEDGGRSSLVPHGFSCESRHDGGLGTPVSDRASEALRQAVHRFDYEAGGTAAAEQARLVARRQDTITLWHLLGRCPPAERGLLFTTMAAYSRPPTTVSRAGIIAGDTKVIEAWKESIIYDLEESELSR